MTSTFLKFLALLFMTIDHIGHFFIDIPIWFRWIGRLSAPIFLFVFVHSLSYTKSKKQLLKRIYIFNIISCGICLCINYSPIKSIVGGIVSLFTFNILGTFFAISLLIILIEYIRDGDVKWQKYLLGYIFIQLLGVIVINVLVYQDLDALGLAFCQLTGNIFLNEGRLYFILLGVMLYYVKNNKKKLVIFYSIFVFLNSFIIINAIVPRILVRMQIHGYWTLYSIFDRIFGVIGYDTMVFGDLSPLYSQFEWMSIGALPFFLLYNGKKGKGYKYLFYIYYPLHIVVLAIMCYIYYF